jgi:ABC-type sugar transport system ATPase subunit
MMILVPAFSIETRRASRAARARASARAEAFLRDELLSNLDVKLRTSMRTGLIKLRRVLGTSIVHVAHD